MFFACDGGDQMSWLGELDSVVPDIWFKNRRNGSGPRKVKSMSQSDRCRRLGIEPINNRRNQIRIAPMRGSDLPRNFLAGKIVEVEKWVRDTLRCVNSSAMPKTFNIIPRLEQPRIGDPFHVLWVNFEFDDTMWDDEVMWDIRYLLMGSKLDKQPGFPTELYDVREKLYITRDGISERGRGPSLD